MKTENGVTTVAMIRGEQGRRRRDYSEGLSLSPHAPVMSWHVNLAVVVDGGRGPHLTWLSPHCDAHKNRATPPFFGACPQPYIEQSALSYFGVPDRVSACPFAGLLDLHKL